METHKLLRRKAASKYLVNVHGVPCAPSTLAKLAVIGGGPVFRRMNRVPLYSIDDLDQWIVSKLSGPMRFTSDAHPADAARPACTRDQARDPDFRGRSSENIVGVVEQTPSSAASNRGPTS
jgi:hypothetical protein